MSKKQFTFIKDTVAPNIKTPIVFNNETMSIGEVLDKLNELSEENEQLKQYKQSVNDVLKSWSQKNLTAKQLQVVLAIMEELNVIGDVE